MHQRINITLPEETIDLLDRVAKRGERSRLISKALHHYVRAIGQAKLRRRLKEGAIRRSTQDRRVVKDWFALDEEVWTQQAKQ